MKKFEEGQSGFDSKGTIVTIESISNDIDKLAISGDNGKLYDREGKYAITGIESDEDLVKLVDDNLGNTENVEVSAVVDTTLDFKVGQKWCRRDGKVVEITNILQDHNYPIITNTGTYTLKGELVKGQTRYNDLVELYVDASESKPVTYLVPGYENVHIRIGDVWLTNGGRTRKVVGLCMGDTYPIKAEAICTTTISGITMSGITKLEFTLAGIFNLDSKESYANLKTLVTSENDNQYIIDEGNPFDELVSDMCDNSNLTEESFKEELSTSVNGPGTDAEVIELVKGQSIGAAMCINQEVCPSFATSMTRLLEQMTNEIKRYNINMLETARTMEELSQVNFNVITLIHKVKALEEEVNKLKP